MNRCSISLIVMLGYLLSGCAIGYNSILFVTKSNFGVDVDTHPPTADIGIKRLEGTISPVFEGGQTPPVLSSFRPESSGLFSGNVSQTFATGDAAHMMAILFASENPCSSFRTKDDYKGCDEIIDALSSKIEVKEEPELAIGSLQKNNVRPVFFGTSTGVGMGIVWTGMNSVFPDQFHFGYKRKEIAIAPVARFDEVSTEATKKYVGAPSLIATIDSEFKAGSPAETDLKWIQYFATGKAATALALQRDVRTAMLRRLDPKSLPHLLPGDMNVARILILKETYAYLKDTASVKDTDKAKTLVTKLDKLGDFVPLTYAYNYWKYEDATILSISKKEGSPIEYVATGFERFNKYWIELVDSMKWVEDAITKPIVVTIDGKPRAEKIDQLKIEQQSMKSLKQSLDLILRNSPEIQEAAYLYLTSPDERGI